MPSYKCTQGTAATATATATAAATAAAAAAHDLCAGTKTITKAIGHLLLVCLLLARPIEFIFSFDLCGIYIVLFWEYTSSSVDS